MSSVNRLLARFSDILINNIYKFGWSSHDIHTFRKNKKKKHRMTRIERLKTLSQNVIAQSAVAVEYTDCTSAEG